MAMTLRLTEEQDAMLTRLAQSEGISKHEVVIRALKENFARSRARADFDNAFTDVSERYADLLDRLGK